MRYIFGQGKHYSFLLHLQGLVVQRTLPSDVARPHRSLPTSTQVSESTDLGSRVRAEIRMQQASATVRLSSPTNKPASGAAVERNQSGVIGRSRIRQVRRLAGLANGGQVRSVSLSVWVPVPRLVVHKRRGRGCNCHCPTAAGAAWPAQGAAVAR